MMANENIYAYMRSDFNETILTVLNKSDDKQTVELNLPAIYKLKDATELLNGNNVEIVNGKFKVDIPAIGWKMFVLN